MNATKQILVFKKGKLKRVCLGYKDAAAYTKVSTNQIWQLMRSGKASKNGFTFDEALEWIDYGLPTTFCS